MKKKFTIIGQNLHDVDYRPFLLAKAMEAGLTGFMAVNRPGTPQTVNVLVEGNSYAIPAFDYLIREDKPPEAMVSSIVTSELTEDVPAIATYFMFQTAEQMNKAVPLLQSMDNKLSNMDRKLDAIDTKLEKGFNWMGDNSHTLIGGQDEMNDKLGTLNEKTSTMHGSVIKGFNLLAASQGEMNDTLGVINETLEEGFKETNEIPEVKERLDRVERNIRILRKSHNMPE